MRTLKILALVAILPVVYMISESMLERNRVAKADAKFAKMVQVATQETGPCSPNPLRLVQPPPHSTKKAVLVIGGKVVNAEEGNNIFLEARQPVLGERAVRVVYLEPEPSFREVVWLAAYSKACEAGLESSIKKYAISGGRAGGYKEPPWPTKQ